METFVPILHFAVCNGSCNTLSSLFLFFKQWDSDIRFFLVFFLLKLGRLGSSIRLLPPCRELLDTSKDTGWTTCLNYFSTHFGWDWRIASYVRLTPASPSDLKKMVPSDLGFFFNFKSINLNYLNNLNSEKISSFEKFQVLNI